MTYTVALGRGRRVIVWAAGRFVNIPGGRASVTSVETFDDLDPPEGIMRNTTTLSGDGRTVFPFVPAKQPLRGQIAALRAEADMYSRKLESSNIANWYMAANFVSDARHKAAAIDKVRVTYRRYAHLLYGLYYLIGRAESSPRASTVAQVTNYMAQTGAGVINNSARIDLELSIGVWHTDVQGYADWVTALDARQIWTTNVDENSPMFMKRGTRLLPSVTVPVDFNYVNNFTP